MKMVKLGMFDHSGVLSDDRKPVYEANMQLLEKYGHQRVSFEKWLSLSKASAGDLIESFEITVPKQEINKEYERVYSEVVNSGLRPKMYSDVPETLIKLKEMRLRLAVVSSHPATNLSRELREYGIVELFDKISGDPHSKKERLIEICQGFEIPTTESFFVEDTIYGLRAGHQANVPCFGVTDGYHSREMLENEKTAIAIIDSLSELPELVKRC